MNAGHGLMGTKADAKELGESEIGSDHHKEEVHNDT